MEIIQPLTTVIKFESGKEIELTEAEVQELKVHYSSVQYVPWPRPPLITDYPGVIPQPYYYHVTCDDNTDLTKKY